MFPADVFNGWEELGSRRGFRSSREVEAADDSYDILRAIKVQGARARFGGGDRNRAMNRGIAQPAAELISIYREGKGTAHEEASWCGAGRRAGHRCSGLRNFLRRVRRLPIARRSGWLCAHARVVRGSTAECRARSGAGGSLFVVEASGSVGLGSVGLGSVGLGWGSSWRTSLSAASTGGFQRRRIRRAGGLLQRQPGRRAGREVRAGGQ